MFRALGTRFVLDWKGADGTEMVGESLRAVWQWAVHDIEPVPVAWQEGEYGDGVSRVQCICAAGGGLELRRTSLHRPDEWDPTVVWRTTVDIVRSAEQVECGVAVELELSHHRIAPTPLHAPLLGLLRQLVRRGARAGSQRVSAELQGVVGTDGVEHFVERTLLDGERRLPVLLFTAIKEKDGVYMPEGTDPSLVARELCGLAHVYILPRAEDSHKLTKRLHQLSAYDGAIRIYWPRFKLTDPPPRHPLHLRQRLNPTSVPAIMRRIVEAGARAYRPPNGTQTLLATRWRDLERARIFDMVAAEHDPEARVAALDRELLHVIDENVRLSQEVDTLRDELERLQRRLDLERAEEEAQPGVEAMNAATAVPSASP